MASETLQYSKLFAARIAIVQKLTELNARHLKSEMRLAGIDFELARCLEAVATGDETEDFRVVRDRLEEERDGIGVQRREINQLRDDLEAELLAVDRQLQ